MEPWILIFFCLNCSPSDRSWFAIPTIFTSEHVCLRSGQEFTEDKIELGYDCIKVDKGFYRTR